jgi:hypothetical protein
MGSACVPNMGYETPTSIHTFTCALLPYPSAHSRRHTQFVVKAEKSREKQRRQRAREEKMEAQRVAQDERLKRALERARAPVKKKTGKPVMFRS